MEANLMEDRYEVIATYPYCPYEVGDLVEFSDSGTSFHCTTTKEWNAFSETQEDCVNWFSVSALEYWPHLFKKLEWWQKRKLSEMPKHIKANDGQVFKVKKWDKAESLRAVPQIFVDMKIHRGFVDTCTETVIYPPYLPATKEDYIEYANNQS